MSLLVILALAAPALAAPLYAGDPVNVRKRQLGQDVFARSIFGARISLMVGLLGGCAAMGGLLIRIIAGYNRSFDNVVMQDMDGLIRSHRDPRPAWRGR
ncbi:hypothetical protein [Mesorhizobium sp. M0633]|uniref:hypothetical protein n=1 Tax=Mesorhizobium sp. M0633 TaxID=2956977 RepID=UPI003335A9F9